MASSSAVNVVFSMALKLSSSCATLLAPTITLVTRLSLGKGLAAPGCQAVQLHKVFVKLRGEDGRLEESLSRHSGILRDAIQVSVGEKALCQGREGDETGSVFLGLLQDSFLLGLAVEDVVATLVDEAGDIPAP